MKKRLAEGAGWYDRGEFGSRHGKKVVPSGSV
jgi:hypothetical protein